MSDRPTEGETGGEISDRAMGAPPKAPRVGVVQIKKATFRALNLNVLDYCGAMGGGGRVPRKRLCFPPYLNATFTFTTTQAPSQIS